ncbi:hypothetical protein DRN86_01765 [Candidatus Geothermarchaeota archaeon]|nr:MAG: hypothetical protein DRN86_01765 [Candidatus Geothermarchaeota archaeon]
MNYWKMKKKKSFFDVFEDIDKIFEEMQKSFTSSMKGSSGYSISVTYDETGRPVVKVETYGDVDKASLKKEIERKYPGAKIIGLKTEPLIEEINEDEEKD